ncbi:MAG: AMP-binding protein [Pseudomonadota bacterium]
MVAAVNTIVDWSSSDCHWLLNPKATPAEVKEKQLAELQAPQMPSHIWLQSSGSSGGKKWIALSKHAFLVSAEGVNQHLSATPKDVWLKCLPSHHVGGLGIYARAHVGGYKVVEQDHWDPSEFASLVSKESATLASLVPTQVYDLVREHILCPESLRAVVVGGDRLDRELYKKARNLGWPLLPSYGSTETCSQIATADQESLRVLDYPSLSLLSHVTTSVTERGTLKVYSECLFSGVLSLDSKSGWKFEARKQPYYLTPDHIEVKAGKIIGVERTQDRIKVLGELVSMSLLRDRLAQVCSQLQVGANNYVVLARPEERKGQEIVLLSESHLQNTIDVFQAFNSGLIGPQQCAGFYIVDEIPRGELGKLKVPEALQLIASKS